MTVLVLFFLVVVWGVVLVPTVMRRQAEARAGDSILDFRRQLRVLQRTAPAKVAPAHRLGPERVAVALHAVPSPDHPAGSARRARALTAQALRRRRTLRRRQDTFMVLLAGTLGSGVLGAVPSLRAVWGLTAVLGVLLGVYVGALIHVRNLAAEREMKLRFLPPPRAQDPALLLRRSAH